MILDYKQRILLGGRELFYKHGIKKITMDDIARHLRISKKTIYKEFKDKNEIVVGICHLDFSEHQTHLEEINNNSENAIDAFVKLMQYVSSYLDSVNANYFYDMQKYHAEAWNVFKQFKHKYVIHTVAENLKLGQNENLYRNNLNIDIIAKLRVAEMDAALNIELYSPDDYKLAEIHEELLRHYLQGITTIKGHRLINKYFDIYDTDNSESESIYDFKKSDYESN